ncbi:unnamed protein product, partial [Didymodactylos carnosus]
RIKEIFLVMKNEDENEPVTHYDMELAKKELLQICQRFIESEKPDLNKQQILSKNEENILRAYNQQKQALENFQKYYIKQHEDNAKSM